MRGRHLFPKLLKIRKISKDNAFEYLEQQSTPVKVLTSPIKNSIESMKLTASKRGLVSLSSSCVHEQIYSAFTLHESPKNGVWASEEYVDEKYDEYINPQILSYSNETVQNQEHCPSFPLLSSIVKRSQNIKVKYQNLQRQKKEEEISGFKSVIFQHQLDHLDGVSLICWERNMGNLFIDQKVAVQFPKTNQLLIDYREKMARLLSEYPEYQNPTINNPPAISFFQDFVRRFLRHYQRQYALYEARQALK